MNISTIEQLASECGLLDSLSDDIFGDADWFRSELAAGNFRVMDEDGNYIDDPRVIELIAAIDEYDGE